MTVRDVRITDSTLRDGSHPMAHRFTVEQVRATVTALDEAGVPVIEVSHGDGLAGSTFNYGFGTADEMDLIAAAVDASCCAAIAVLLIPGVGTGEQLRRAHDRGARIARMATHCTEADVANQHFGIARDLGMETVGFLMLSHMAEPARLAAEARVMVDAGCQCVYVVDSAGALIVDGTRARVAALVQEVGDDAEVGFHAHNNLGLAAANSLAAYEEGARQIDASTRGLGAGAGNTATEVITAVFERAGIVTGIDLPRILAAAEELVAGYAPRTPIMDRSSIILGFAGAYSSFLLHAERAERRYGVPAHEILLEVGRRGYVGGQEDMIIDVALTLADQSTTDAAEHA